MLKIKIVKTKNFTYTIQIYRDRELIKTREIETTNYLDVFESLEAILKCLPEAKAAMGNS